jgi:hypothetical protein
MIQGCDSSSDDPDIPKENVRNLDQLFGPVATVPL